MQLLIQLPRLPFSAVFDILFRHGGFAAFADVHGSEAMYQFWRIFFVSSPMGKLHPLRISAWVEAVCACHIVQSLPHPAHAVYLLRPVRHEIPESVSAWAIAGGRGNQTMPPEIVINAMKAFLPCNHDQLEQPFLQREWFCVSELFFPRSTQGWVQFADDVISNHFFTHYWWNQQKECPFQLLEGARGPLSMGKVIKLLVQRETLALRQSLQREETVNMIRELQRKQWKKERDQNPQSHSKDKKPQIHHNKGKKAAAKQTPIPPAPLTINKKPKSPALSTANKQEILRLAQLRYNEHTNVLSQAKSALASMPVSTLDDNFLRVLGLVVSLGHAFPRIKWSVRLALHEVANETGRSTWDIERELYRVMYRRVHDPLTKLKALSGK